MGKLTIETDTFLDVLYSLTPTSGGTKDDDTLDGVFLYTQRGPYGEEPGDVNLLAGLSTNGVIAGHYFRPFDVGTFEPSFWPSSAISLVASAFGSRSKEQEDEHVIVIEQLQDNKVSVTEYGKPEDGVEVIFSVRSADTFPYKGVKRWLSGELDQRPAIAQDEVPIKQSNTELWTQDSIGPLLKLAKSWKSRLLLHKKETSKPYIVTMEGIRTWTGAIVPPIALHAESINDGPDTDVYLDIPDIKA